MIDGSTSFAVTTLALIGCVVLYVWIAFALAAVFRKSGEEGWKAWVPVFNLVALLQLGGVSGWLLLLGLIPFVGVLAVWVLVIVACHRVGAAFGFGGGMTVLAALLLPVWASVIGFGTSRWVGAESPASVRRSTVEESPAGVRRTGDDEYSAAPRPRPAAPAAGWVPPPLPSSAAVAASAPPPVPPLPVTERAEPLPAPGDPMPVPSRASLRSASYSSWEGLPDADEYTGEVTGAAAGAPAPISAVPPTVIADEAPGAPLRRGSAAGTLGGADAEPPVTRVPVAAAPQPATDPWAPSRSPMSDPEAFAETSGPVSAIAGAPDAGSPRSARSSVSALYVRGEIPDDVVEQTEIAQRRRTVWSLVPPTGQPVGLSGAVVLVGRRPVADPGFPGAQLIAIQDGTVSKTHARLELREDTWYITDLDSTNGVLFATVMGTEVEAPPGVEVEAGERFLLGDAEIRLIRGEA